MPSTYRLTKNNGVLPAGTKITVHGHTDSIGDASYNQSLSEQRAKTAKKAIVEATGIDPKLVEVVGHGEKNPIADNATRKGRALNRRVEIDVKAPVKEKEQVKPAPAAPADKKVEVSPQEKAAAERQKALVAALASLDRGIPENASVAQTREWRDKTMKLYNSLDDSGKQAVTSLLQKEYGYAEGQQTFDPVSFFDQRIAQAAVGELKGATTTTTRYYIPLTTSKIVPPPVPTVETVPDPIKIHHVLRQLGDLPFVLSRVHADPAVQEIRNKLPKKPGWLTQEDGVHQEALDARLRGDAVRAEAGFVRSLIENTLSAETRKLDEITKKAIKDAYLPYEPATQQKIKEEYQQWFKTDLLTDLKKANASVILEPTKQKPS